MKWVKDLLVNDVELIVGKSLKTAKNVVLHFFKMHQKNQTGLVFTAIPTGWYLWPCIRTALSASNAQQAQSFDSLFCHSHWDSMDWHNCQQQHHNFLAECNSGENNKQTNKHSSGGAPCDFDHEERMSLCDIWKMVKYVGHWCYNIVKLKLWNGKKIMGGFLSTANWIWNEKICRCILNIVWEQCVNTEKTNTEEVSSQLNCCKWHRRKWM